MKLNPVTLATFTRQSINELSSLKPGERRKKELVLSELVVHPEHDEIAPLDIKLMINSGYVVITTQFLDDTDANTDPMFELIGTTGKVMELVEDTTGKGPEKVRQVIERATRESIDGTLNAHLLLARKIIAAGSHFRIAEAPGQLRGYRSVPGFESMCNLGLALELFEGRDPFEKFPGGDLDNYILKIGPRRSSLRISRDAA